MLFVIFIELLFLLWKWSFDIKDEYKENITCNDSIRFLLSYVFYTGISNKLQNILAKTSRGIGILESLKSIFYKIYSKSGSQSYIKLSISGIFFE